MSWAQLCTAVPLSLPFAALITVVLCLQCYQLESRGHCWCVEQTVDMQCFQLREDTRADVSCSVLSWGKTLGLMCWSGCCLAVFSAERRHHGWCVNQTVVLQCFQLKEREEYLKLLQQHTTVDLGYHANKTQGASARGHHSQRSVWLAMIMIAHHWQWWFWKVYLSGYDSDSTPLAMVILKGLSYWLW